MIPFLRSNAFRKKAGLMLFCILAFQTFYPVMALALGSGPVQPEAQGFEPVGTTDMIDLFTGDFVYNIPLMDVEGYPINIAYHGGVGMEQEASWVGLGWNINPGAINRAVRGLPDDFAGDTIEKHYFVKPDKTTKIGLSAGAEALGVGDPYIKIGADMGGYLTLSNYRGVSVDFTTNVGVNANFGPVTAGVNLGASVGSQTGAAINYGAHAGIGLNFNASGDVSASAAFNLNTGGNYSPRTGTHNYQSMDIKVSMSERTTGASTSFSMGTFVPIGIVNHTAAMTNPTYSNSYSGQLKLGIEGFSIYGHAKAFSSFMENGFLQNGSRKGYGYLNLDLADQQGNDLLDFSREKDGMYNSTMDILPQSSLTYDVYSVSGQGTGGSFRPYRNDIGSVYDPLTVGGGKANDLDIEGGIGELFEIGSEFKHSATDITSGPWDEYSRPFTPRATSGYYEGTYFKEAGELTPGNGGSTQVVTPETMNEVGLTTATGGRVTRANHIYTVSADDKDTALLLDSKSLYSYETPGFKTYPSITKTLIARRNSSTNTGLGRKPSQATEIVQLQKDGRRYVYGLPVMNNVQREAIYAIGSNQVNKSNYSVNYVHDQADTPGNRNGIDNFYSSTVTPSYVSANLLTGVLSADYVDVTGDGITDDDLGTYTKFNYTRKSTDYRWRSPIDSNKSQYIPGYISDTRDDKATYLVGSRENWMMHSVETKNYVAEFYVSARKDAKGVNNKILSNSGLVYHDAKYLARGADTDQRSYKLDSIVLYNKHDRFINGNAAQPIKTVLFSYDYSLCKGVPNADTGTGKLTLRKIQMRYGRSNINMSACYSFNYSDKNYNYSAASKDRWGTYKPNDPNFNNYEFPFTTQSDSTNSYAQAWSLTDIGLPSGGKIKVDYESDDYAYVQDQEAMEMFKVAGLGNSSNYDNGTELYHSPDQPNLFLYFNRRDSAENGNLSFRENYLKDKDLLYYNVPVRLAADKYEPIKGYAHVVSMGICPNDSHRGYVELEPQKLENGSGVTNPITYTALNIGRYNLPHVMFPGSDPDATDLENVIAGLKGSFGELFHIAEDPLKYYMSLSKGKDADINKGFVRLTSPGLKKKGGGQRVKRIRFFDQWSAMTTGNDAVYGKEYDYTMLREDKKGFISSGVASWEPSTGGDELPQREPKPFEAQAGSHFPPNDPVDLYQELPIGESFFPAPVVGYSKITARSIHKDEGRSSQSEDINYFYTAKDFPVQTQASPIRKGDDNKFKLDNTKVEDWATQGFSIVLNDMHGKPMNTEHWVLKPDTGSKARELVSYQRNDYYKLGSSIPVFDYTAAKGTMSVVNRAMGSESEVTVDTRKKDEKTTTEDLSINVNGFIVGIALIVIPVPYVWPIESSVNFRSATATKITQQYGILNKVTTFNQGAITELKNEVFDAQTGNALVTSVNNEFKDREYTVNYPAHWAYKEMGPSYENQNLQGVFKNSLVIDTFGLYQPRFINYNGAYSNHYDLPSNMPVGKTVVDDDMPMYKLGDELLLNLSAGAAPVRTWVMGYTSDTNNCYLVLANRQPYESEGAWHKGQTLGNVGYRVIKSGNKNRLGETIQTYTTTNKNNIFPTLKDSLPELISLVAHRYNHNLNQVSAANVTTDSLNPFVTGKVGIYRPELEAINLKSRDYNTGTVRKQGTYPSNSYWKTETDNFCSYCGDISQCSGGYDQSYLCPQLLDSMRWEYLGGDSARITVRTVPGDNCQESYGIFGGINAPNNVRISFTNIGNNTQVLIFHDSHLLVGGYGNNFTYENCCCRGFFEINQKLTGPTFQPLFCPSCSYQGLDQSVIYRAPNLTVDSVRSHLYATGGCLKSNSRVYKKILLGKVGHYDGDDNENWVKTNQVTKYNSYGAELENKEEGVGYNSAMYGYNQQLPACVAKNARAGEVLFDGFEDYALLQAKPSMREQYMKLLYSPFATYLGGMTGLGSLYQTSTLNGVNMGFSISNTEAHTGTYSLKTNTKLGVTMPMNIAAGGAKGYSFGMDTGRTYVASVWLRPVTISTTSVSSGYSGHMNILMDTVLTGGPTGAQLTKSLVAKSNIIDGWQQFELTFKVPAKYKKFDLYMDPNYYYDDIRIYPVESNSKGFVYHPVTRKLMATLDENNYATFYEYDAEGNLIRTKKETEQGVMTVSETRSTHAKTNP